MEFYQNQPFLVAAARDSQGHMWSTLFTNPSGTADLVHFANDRDPTKLYLQGGPVPGDALFGEIHAGSDLGLLGIEFATKRRNRVNGRIVQVIENDDSSIASSPDTMIFHVDQSFGNCPQYIQPRQWWSAPNNNDHGDDTPPSKKDTSSTKSPNTYQRPNRLTPDQINFIEQAETIFVASGYRGEGEDVRFGNDASHRGGSPGFVMVQRNGADNNDDANTTSSSNSTLILPDFSGNDMFNTLGNLRMDPRMGITIPDFRNGGMLQLSGRATVDMDSVRAASVYPGALRLITFEIGQVNQVAAGSLPIRWSATEQERPLQIKAIVKESEDVKSFYLQPLPQDPRPLWKFQAGQHLPVRLQTADGTEVWRTYSLSGSPNNTSPDGGVDYYRISVKREFLGVASRILHDEMEVGDVFEVSRPAGDFVLPKVLNSVAEEEKKSSHDDVRSLTLVLLSNGIGVTPLLSMLHTAVTSTSNAYNYSRVVWIHGARDSLHHPLANEVRDLQKASANIPVAVHVRYSQPQSQRDEGLYDSQGHIDGTLLLSMVPSEMEVWHADYYLCGSSAFVNDMEESLDNLGVESSHVHVESF